MELERTLTHKLSLEDCREINVLGAEREIRNMGRVMTLWLPQTERRLEGISAVVCNNGPLSQWQSLIIQYEEDSSLSPPLSFLCFFFLMIFFPSSAFSTLQFAHAAPLFPVSLSSLI